MALTSEQWKSLEDMAQQIGRETIANGLGSPQAQGTGSPSYSENASPRERYNQLWEIRKQQAAEAAESAEQLEERRERVRSNFLTTMQEIQNQQRNRGSASEESTASQAANAPSAANPVEYSTEQLQAAKARTQELSEKLDNLKATKSRALTASPYAAAAYQNIASDEEIRNAESALALAQKQQERMERDTARAKQAAQVRAVDEALERGVGYADQYEAYSQSLKALNAEKQKLTQQLSDIRGGRAGYFGQENADAQEKAEEDTESRIERLTREIERIEGQRNYASLNLGKDKNAAVIIRQGEELSKNLKEVWDNNDEVMASVMSEGRVARFRDKADRYHPTANWTPEQQAVYNYLLAAPNHGAEDARDYAAQINDAINRGLNTAATAQDYAWGAQADGNFLQKAGATAALLPAGIAAAPSHALSWMEKISDVMQGNPYVKNAVPTLADRISAATKGRAEQLNKDGGTVSEAVPIVGGKGFGDLFQLGQSAAESLILGNLVGEAATLGSFFVQAADTTFDEAKSRGGSDEYAAMFSTLSGLAEVLGEKISLDHMLKGGNIGSLKYVLKQAGIEGAEEVNTSVLNQFFDRITANVTGDQTAIQGKISALVRQGMSYEEAEKRVWKETVEDVAWDFVGGFVSGGMSGAVQSGVRGTQNKLWEMRKDSVLGKQNAEDDPMRYAPKNDAGQQEAPAGQITPPAAPNAQGEAGAQSQTAETAQERLERAQARYAELESAFDNGEVSEADADDLSREMEQRYSEIQELKPLAERERQSAADAQTQQARVQNGEVSKGYGTPENHIDRRTPENVGNVGMKSFQFDNPQLHGYYVEAAQALFNEVQNAEDADYGRKVNPNTRYERGSAITGPIRRLMDMGLTKPQIVRCLQDIIADNGQENYAAAKRVELVLNDMLTNGWQGQRGRNDWHEANADYIAAKDAIDGGIKADSWEKYLADHELSLITGEVTEEELRAEWEQMHPQEEATTVAEPEAAPGPVQPAETASTEGGQSTGTIPASEQTTAERANGQGPQRERGMSENLRNNEKAEPDLRNSFEQNRDLYTQLTNAEVAEKAAEIVGKGYDAAKNDIYEKIGQAKVGAKFAPEYAVAGYQLANEMVRRGETEAARELCADIAAELTYAGQVGQIGRLILASDPSIRVRTVNRLVQKLNDGLSNRQKAKNVKKGVGTESGEIKVPDEALQRYAEAETDEAANDAMDAIEQEIADQIPATFRDKFTALRYLNMLGNLKTQGRNIVGNTAMMAATNAKYLTQHVIELARAAATGGKYQGNTALNTSKELRQQAAADFEANIDEIKGDTKYSDVGRQAAKGIRDKQQIFGAKTGNALWDNTVRRIGQGLEVARKATNAAIDIGDEIFMRQVYVRSFAGWMKAHGVTDVNNASAEQVSAAREFAKKEAQEATFHDSNKVSDWFSSLGRGQNTPKVVKMISEGIVPFRKTPANVAVRAVEYSPVGIAGTIYTAVQAKKGNASAADVINSAAKNLPGTALFAAGMMLAAAGRARASGDDEDEKLANFQKLQGAMDYSVKVGDTYISLSQLAPMAIPFFMGVKLNELMETNDNLLSLDSVGDILGVVSEPMLEMSMLSGVNDFLNDLSSVSGDTGGLPALVGNAALSYLSQGLTNTLLGQFEQMSERNRQATYTDTKSEDATAFDRFLGKNQYKIGQYSAKIPGVDYNQQDYVDAWGRTQSNGGAGERAFNALLNPTYTGKDRSTDVDEELERLHRENKGKEGFPDVFPQKRSRSDAIGDGVVMTPDEYLAFSKESGQKKLELVREFMQSSDYKNLTDEQRADVISNLYSFADNLALRSTRESYGIKKENDTYKLLSGTDKPGDAYDIPALKEKNAGEYIAFDTLYKGAVKSKEYSTIDNLLYRYSKLNGNTRAVVDAKKPDDLSTLLKFRDSGASAKDYYAIKESIGEEQWNLDVSSAQGGHVRLAGLGSADIPDSKKDKLVESGAFKLSSTAKNAYGVLRNAGLKPEQISEWFENADWYASGTGKEATADGSLNAYEVAVAISKMSGLDDSQREALYQQFKSALQKPNDAYDTWKNYNYRQTLGRAGNYGKTVGRETAPKSGNALYDYYAERMKNAK